MICSAVVGRMIYEYWSICNCKYLPVEAVHSMRCEVSETDWISVLLLLLFVFNIAVSLYISEGFGQDCSLLVLHFSHLLYEGTPGSKSFQKILWLLFYCWTTEVLNDLPKVKESLQQALEMNQGWLSPSQMLWFAWNSPRAGNISS